MTIIVGFMAIYKFTAYTDIEKMSTEELFEYKKFLEVYKQHLREDMQNWVDNAQAIKHALKGKLQQLDQMLYEAEIARIEADGELLYALNLLH